MVKRCEVCVEHDLRVGGKRTLPGGRGGGEKGLAMVRLLQQLQKWASQRERAKT